MPIAKAAKSISPLFSVALECRSPPPLQAGCAARLRSRANPQGCWTFKRRNRDVTAKRCLGIRDDEDMQEVISFSHEKRVGKNVHLYVEVARLVAVGHHFALSSEPKLVSIVDTDWDFHGDSSSFVD